MTTTTAVRRLLETTGLSQGELGRRSGVSPGRISEYGSGKHDPSMGQLERLARAAGVELRVEFVPEPDLWSRAESEALPAWRSMRLEGQEVSYEHLVWRVYADLSAEAAE